jgi:DNA-directed RNA polymerase subunit RPC12/RpoP
VPGAVLTGLTLGIIRVRQREIFESAEAACPYCGTVQRLGLAGRTFRLPRAVHCHNCGRQLDLGLDSMPATDAIQP